MQDKQRHTVDSIRATLAKQGWILLSDEDYNLERFGALMRELCAELTYDPARENVSKASQKVDAGTAPVGLHIENGNTPMPPDIIAFHSELSAAQGSQTTLCDGHEVYKAMPEAWRQRYSQSMTVSRYLPQAMWQKYVATAMGIDDPTQISEHDAQRFLQSLPGQEVRWTEDGGVEYTLSFNAIRQDNLAMLPAFANALLGPSYNYQPPLYRFADGQVFDTEMAEELAAFCEPMTREIAWQDGDVAVIDNKRCMHGRREILVPLAERKLYIAMGLNPTA